MTQAAATLEPPALLPELLRIVAEATDCGRAVCYLLERDALAQAAWWNYDGPFTRRHPRIPVRSATGESALTRTPRIVRVEDWSAESRDALAAEGFFDTLIVPLQIQGKVAGTVNVIRTTPRRFEPADVEIATGIAAHVAVALERARLFEEEKRRARDLKLINELGAAVSGELELQRVLDLAARHVARIADASQGFVLIAHDGRLRMMASNVDDPGVLEIVIERGEVSLALEAMAERKPVIVNTLPDPRVSPSRLRRFGHTALAAVPLIARGEPIGAVMLAETRPGARFEDAQIERAAALVTQLSIAIANARLFDDLKKRNEQLASAQRKLVQRERLAALGELAAQVAHEVRNPLAVIFNSIATLRRDPKQPMLLDIVAEEAERLNRIVSELLDFARPAEPRLERGSLEPVIAGATEAAARLGAKISVSIPETLPLLDFDAQLVRQALLNLMENAAHAHPGGEIRVCAFEERVAGGRACARIDIADSGPGIPAEVAPLVFQPFFTTRAQGTGLGLAIVKRIAEAHGGDVGFEPALPRGTIFTLRLPIE